MSPLRAPLLLPLLLLLLLLAATAAATADSANDTAGSCTDPSVCGATTKAALFTPAVAAAMAAVPTAAAATASQPALLLPSIPALRRRTYVPAGTHSKPRANRCPLLLPPAAACAPAPAGPPATHPSLLPHWRRPPAAADGGNRIRLALP